MDSIQIAQEKFSRLGPDFSWSFEKNLPGRLRIVGTTKHIWENGLPAYFDSTIPEEMLDNDRVIEGFIEYVRHTTKSFVEEELEYLAETK